MRAIEVDNLHKAYGQVKAVNNLSFSVERGEIFGFIGQNGAGKTTTIRILMNIINRDKGRVSLLSQEINESIKDRIGYLPEESGLYKKSKVMKVILYFASLKGMNKKHAVIRTEELLKRFNLYQHRHIKMGQLSKGMSQLVQFIVAIVHDPEIVILDEPFSGLDPSNVDVIKGIIHELRKDGKTIFFSAHNMHDIEELCDRILMIKDGKKVLYGSLSEIKEEFREEDRFYLKTESNIDELSELASVEKKKDCFALKLNKGISSHDVLSWLLEHKIKVDLFELAKPNLNEIFLEIAGGNDE